VDSYPTWSHKTRTWLKARCAQIINTQTTKTLYRILVAFIFPHV
jgi:hypothetical protein